MRKGIVAGLALLLNLSSLPAMAAEKNSQPVEPELNFYLVRHGQTFSNIKQLTIGGGGNAPLTPQGRRDASNLGLGLSAVNFIAAYSSPLGRARETAERVLTGRDLPLNEIEELKDISWGDAEGGTIAALKKRYGHSGDDFAWWFGDPQDKNFSSSIHTENMFHFNQRFERGLREIARRHQGQSGNILVAAHSSMAFYLQTYRPGQPLSGLSNTSVSVLSLKNNQFRLVDFNNTDYLQQGYGKEKVMAPLEINIVVNPLTLLRAAERIEGQSDSDFTEEGKLANRKMARQLRDKKWLGIWRSELGRGVKTADAVVADTGIVKQVNTSSQLNELFLDVWETESFAHLKRRSDTAPALFIPGRVVDVTPPGAGESGAVAAARLDSFLTTLAERYANSQGAIAIFTHPLILDAFLQKRFKDYPTLTLNRPMIVTLDYKNQGFTVRQIQTF